MSIDLDDSYIVVGSPMKSGTWLVRALVSELTGKEWFEPPIKKGMRPDDKANIVLEKDRFYSWHFNPVPEIRDILILNDVYCIFIVRNIYSVVVSMYYHFFNNIDWEISRGANKQHYFRNMSVDDGIRRVIVKGNSGGFSWEGIFPHLLQIKNILEFSLHANVCLVSYEMLVKEKKKGVVKLADFLGRKLTDHAIDQICSATSFVEMKKKAMNSGGGSHFRAGSIEEHHKVISYENRKLIDKEILRLSPEIIELSEKLSVPHVFSWENDFQLWD